MHRKWRLFFPGYVWSLPHTLIGLLLAILAYGVREFHWVDGRLECVAGTFERDGKKITRIWGRPGAQTHGWLVIFANEDQLLREDLRVHENCHIVQGLIGGPFYALAYVLAFLFLWARQGFKDWPLAYHAIPFEKQAYWYQREFNEGRAPLAWGTYALS